MIKSLFKAAQVAFSPAFTGSIVRNTQMLYINLLEGISYFTIHIRLGIKVKIAGIRRSKIPQFPRFDSNYQVDQTCQQHPLYFRCRHVYINQP